MVVSSNVFIVISFLLRCYVTHPTQTHIPNPVPCGFTVCVLTSSIKPSPWKPGPEG